MSDDPKKAAEVERRTPSRAHPVKPLVERRVDFAQKQIAQGKGVVPDWAKDLPIEGSGPPNRHGMPRLPPGQRSVPNWPVLDLGVHPTISRAEWRLTIDGLVERPTTLTFDDLMALPQIEEESDFHCVTTWSRMDLRLGGVRLVDLFDRVGVKPEATHLLEEAYDVDPTSGEAYTTNVSLEEARKPDVLLVHSWDGKPLPTEHGGPVRLVTPQLYAWKGAKWIRKITLLDHDQSGFWERRGYSDSAIPWYDDRYQRRSR